MTRQLLVLVSRVVGNLDIVHWQPEDFSHPCLFAEAGGLRYVFDLETPRTPVSLKSPFAAGGGHVEDWEVVEAILDYSLGERLQVNAASGTGRESPSPTLAGHPFLLAEHINAPKEDRETWCELLFETYDAAGVFIARSGTLALYANAKTTGIAVDMGAGGTQITPVQDGFALMEHAYLHPVGGALLDACIADRLDRAGARLDARVLLPFQKMRSYYSSESYHAWLIARTVRELKQSLCQVASSSLESTDLGETAAISFELPDGTHVGVGLERFAVPELVFNPAPLLHAEHGPNVMGSLHLVGQVAGATAASSASPSFLRLCGLHDAIASVASSCDHESRHDLVSGLVLAGAASRLRGLHARLEREFSALAVPRRMRPRLAFATKEQALGTWLGGSILGSLSGFPELWFSKAEYYEHGGWMVHKKCP